MRKLIQKLENVSKVVIAIVSACTAVMGVLIGIYHGIYRLNQTADSIVKAVTSVENNSRFTRININYDIAMAEQQLTERGDIDRLQMKKLLLYKQDLKLEPEQSINIDYLKSKTKY